MNKILIVLTIIFLMIITGEVYYIFVYQKQSIQAKTAGDSEVVTSPTPMQYSDVGVLLQGQQFINEANAQLVIEGKIVGSYQQNDRVQLKLFSPKGKTNMSLLFKKDLYDKAIFGQELNANDAVKITLNFDILNNSSDNPYTSVNITKINK